MPAKEQEKGNGKEANLSVWRPFSELARVEREMENLFGNFFDRPFGSFLTPAWTERTPLLRNGFREPALELIDQNDELIVKAETPGMVKDNLEVKVTGDLLTISGEKKHEEEKKEKGTLYSERSYGSFVRNLRLPTTVQADKIKAKYKDGVLEVHLPKTEEAKRKETKITIEG